MQIDLFDCMPLVLETINPDIWGEAFSWVKAQPTEKAVGGSMKDREKQVLKVLRRNPAVQQNELEDMMQIGNARVTDNSKDLMRKG